MSPKNNSGFLKYSFLAFQMISSILVFVFLGRYIDTFKWTSFPIFTVTGVFLGLGVSLYQVFNSIKQIK